MCIRDSSTSISTTELGSPIRSKPLPSQAKLSLATGTGADWEKINAKPLAINMTPSVTIKAGMLKSVTRLPVPIPIIAQTRIPAALPNKRCPMAGSALPESCWMDRAVMTPLKAIKLPTDKSMPAVMITMVIPIAIMATTEICLSTFSRFSFFKKFHDKYPALTPYRTEWRIFDASVSIAGTVDMVYKKNNGDVFIFDWKRSTKLVDQQGNMLLKDFKYGLEGLSHVEDNSFNRYVLQQNIYKYILESNYGAKVSSMNLLVLHPDYKDFIHLPVPEMKKEAKYLIEQATELSR